MEWPQAAAGDPRSLFIGTCGQLAEAGKVIKIGRVVRRAVFGAPDDRDDVDAKLLRSRPQRRFEAAEAAFDAIELFGQHAPLWRGVIGAGFDLDRHPAASSPGQDVDLPGRKAQVAGFNAITVLLQERAGEVFAQAASSVSGAGARGRASRGRAH